MQIFFDDDDDADDADDYGDDDDDDGDDKDGDDDDDDDDDDDVERTHTGPHAVRSDLEHKVKHNAKKYSMFPTFSAHTKKAGQQARANRGVWP